MENICYNCEKECDDGDIRHNDKEGDRYFCRTCLDTGILDEDEWY